METRIVNIEDCQRALDVLNHVNVFEHNNEYNDEVHMLQVLLNEYVKERGDSIDLQYRD